MGSRFDKITKPKIIKKESKIILFVTVNDGVNPLWDRLQEEYSQDEEAELIRIKSHQEVLAAVAEYGKE